MSAQDYTLLSPNRSARCTIKVLALAMSMPDSMMAVHASTVVLAVHERRHHALGAVLPPSGRAPRHAGVRNQRCHRSAISGHVGHAVVHEVNLTSPAQSASQGIAHDVRIPRNDARFDGQAGCRGGVAMMERSRVFQQ